MVVSKPYIASIKTFAAFDVKLRENKNRERIRFLILLLY
jgi:hypothetical protein